MQYSIVIKFIKYFFISISIVIFVFLALKTIPTKEKTDDVVSFDSEKFSSASQILSNPLFMGLDKKKKPFKISALKATRFNDNQDEFNLENPKGEIETETEKFFMKGNYGVYNSKSQILKVEGNVNLTNMSSLEFITSEAFFDFKKELLFSNVSVTGKKDGSFITAEGFKILNKKNKIIFTGKSKLILNQK
ncbi:MAG: LPS export ABC transporter periplasmic protein LptC [Alphaproteobacteria bacterium]|nr:LPS export ABC transporter periplasmic protein LptC [Alphaproteobacteria bacterium]